MIAALTGITIALLLLWVAIAALFIIFYELHKEEE